MGIPFGSDFLFMSFLQKVLDDDVCHVDVFLRLRDVQIALGISF
jgi:hypothetical protein